MFMGGSEKRINITLFIFLFWIMVERGWFYIYPIYIFFFKCKYILKGSINYAQFKVSGSCIPRVSLSFAVTQYFWSDANVIEIYTCGKRLNNGIIRTYLVPFINYCMVAVIKVLSVRVSCCARDKISVR